MISVIMSVYNGDKFLSSSIESILKQTYSDFELLILDDGSTDNTSKILNSYRNHEKNGSCCRPTKFWRS